jgi:hypothetical protein
MFQKGQSGNPKGRPPGRSPSQMVVYDLKQAARKYAPEALEVIARCMRDKDARVRLMAANIMLERGYGKPQQQVDAEVVHKFARVPEVMEQSEWLARRGRPLLTHDAKLTPDAPTTLTRDPAPDDEKLN